uniref:Regenerating islet-derived 3 alpha n=1 Tax=Nannospalax galili TaxID=1026970 RepID=A0A8C6W643_NANGA
MLPCMTLGCTSWLMLSCLILLSRVQGKVFLPLVKIPRRKLPLHTSAYHSHCYALFMTPKSWFNADLACQKQPLGHLVFVLSGAEASFVSSLVKSRVNNYQYVWIGLHDPTLEWSNSDVLNYVNWDRNPASALGYCGSLTKTSGFLKWKDYHYDVELPYVCKFKF